jgi:quinoprotein relay system zinc metallohydrolase 2
MRCHLALRVLAALLLFFAVGLRSGELAASAPPLITAPRITAPFITPPFVAPIIEVAPGDYVRVGETAEATAENRDGIANTGFIVGDAAVAVVDPGGSLADGQSLRAEILSRTSLPIRYVIMTHDHPDHVFGGRAFSADHPVFVGSWRLPAGMADRAAYDHARLSGVLGEAATGAPVPPTMLVRNATTLDLGGRVLVLQAHATAHTGDDLTIYDRTSRTLWAGDLLFVGRVPALDGSLKGWLHVLDEIEAIPAIRAIPGHGPASVPWPQGDADERRYLTVLLHDVRAAIAAGQDIDKAAATAAASEHGKWALFDAYNGRNVTEAYKELQWE